MHHSHQHTFPLLYNTDPYRSFYPPSHIHPDSPSTSPMHPIMATPTVPLKRASSRDAPGPSHRSIDRKPYTDTHHEDGGGGKKKRVSLSCAQCECRRFPPTHPFQSTLTLLSSGAKRKQKVCLASHSLVHPPISSIYPCSLFISATESFLVSIVRPLNSPWACDVLKASQQVWLAKYQNYVWVPIPSRVGRASSLMCIRYRTTHK